MHFQKPSVSQGDSVSAPLLLCKRALQSRIYQQLTLSPQHQPHKLHIHAHIIISSTYTITSSHTPNMSTPVAGKGLAHQRRAQQARQQPVYISGVKGQHSLEVGVAYFYRGHHIYSAAAANPIDPIPFSTRRGISVVGVAQHLAPPYAPQAADLVPEASIRALHYSYRHALKKLEEGLKAAAADTLQEEAEKKKSGGKMPVLGTVTALDDTSFTPHDRAQYLAASAPGSGQWPPLPCRQRFATVQDAGWPWPQTGREPIEHQCSESDSRRGRARGNLAPSAQQGGSETKSRRPSTDNSPRATNFLSFGNPSRPYNIFSSAQASRAQTPFPNFSPSPSPSPTLLYLPGLGQTTPQNFPTTTTSTRHRRGSSIARPRAASIALNNAYNAANPHRPTPTLDSCPERPTSTAAAPKDTASSNIAATESTDFEEEVQKCALHGDECDGETVTSVHQTEQARRERGFQDVYPTITVGGRTMIDWVEVMRMEKERMMGQ
ncbi:predicted protein [Plenodomus lingam JN3]|uniref:Predicted protein n=1 Tax=Leptosphaeria maculans (strain JN3 / isolate v23.1.3 / race Av1-4-5-6-7-8) TaxID=985895 RepID=E4ZHY6_LEPMJ|nr:predicted protein [Plenodomus lingam JN3]CBX91129.1 predicted protein [Plenodomus lingam JN3]